MNPPPNSLCSKTFSKPRRFPHVGESQPPTLGLSDAIRWRLLHRSRLIPNGPGRSFPGTCGPRGPAIIVVARGPNMESLVTAPMNRLIPPLPATRPWTNSSLRSVPGKGGTNSPPTAMDSTAQSPSWFKRGLPGWGGSHCETGNREHGCQQVHDRQDRVGKHCHDEEKPRCDHRRSSSPVLETVCKPGK